MANNKGNITCTVQIFSGRFKIQLSWTEISPQLRDK